MAEPVKGNSGVCRCPYCDMEVEAREEAVFCVACEVRIVPCGQCGMPVREGVETCPHCGGPPGR